MLQLRVYLRATMVAAVVEGLDSLAGVRHLSGVIDLLPGGFSLHEIPTGQAHVNASTFFVALAAGVAGMLALGIGDLTQSWSGSRCSA